jgi:hypothetical protein
MCSDKKFLKLGMAQFIVKSTMVTDVAMKIGRGIYIHGQSTPFSPHQ